jgi:hypothetical protein
LARTEAAPNPAFARLRSASVSDSGRYWSEGAIRRAAKHRTSPSALCWCRGEADAIVAEVELRTRSVPVVGG